MQTRKHSIVETLTQVTTGYFLSLLLQIIIFPLYNVHLSIHQNIQIGIWFTIAAVAKGYFVRRMFNKHAIKIANLNKVNVGA
jgi:hypothetical protein